MCSRRMASRRLRTLYRLMLVINHHRDEGEPVFNEIE